MLFETDDFILDLTREKLDYTVMEEFQKLFDQYIHPKIEAMRNGDIVNPTENREVLHFALRAKEPYIHGLDVVKNLQKEALDCLEKI